MLHDFSRHNAIVICLHHRLHQNTVDEIQEPSPFTNDMPISGGGDDSKPTANPSYSVRPNGAFHQWREDSPRELSVDPGS